MTFPATVEEERGPEEEAQPPAFEGDDMEAVRAYVLQLLTEGKYRDGLPLHRQQTIFDKRHGVRLPASTLGDWVAGASDLLSPVVALLKQRTLADALPHTDDTGVRVGAGRLPRLPGGGRLQGLPGPLRPHLSTH